MEFPDVAKEAAVLVLRPESSSGLVKGYASLSVQIKAVLKPASRAVWSLTKFIYLFIYLFIFNLPIK